MTRSATAEGATAALAEFVATWRPGDHWPTVRRESARALLDLVGVMLVGTREPASRLAAAFARAEGAEQGAVVAGHNFRTSASLAAFANGTSGHALDFDDIGDTAGGGHRSVCLVPAALAVGEICDASGRELLEAIAVGFEIITRTGHSAGGETGESYRRGFHGTSVFGVLGATAAAARILGLDTDGVRRAFGIAASGPKGLRANYGTMGKPLHAGEANRAGVAAALLARSGFDANPSALEARFGWSDVVAGDGIDWQELTEGLGERLAIENGINAKPFPTCAANDAPVRALLRAINAQDLVADDVERIEVEISANVLEQTLVVNWPTTGLEGKFSLAYNLAAAIADRRVTVATFEDRNVARLASLRDRVVAVPVAGRPPVVVRLRARDGREIVEVEPTRTGALDDAELAAKFRGNVGLVHPPERVEAIYEAVTGADGATSVRSVAALLE